MIHKWWVEIKGKCQVMSDSKGEIWIHACVTCCTNASLYCAFCVDVCWKLRMVNYVTDSLVKVSVTGYVRKLFVQWIMRSLQILLRNLDWTSVCFGWALSTFHKRKNKRSSIEMAWLCYCSLTQLTRFVELQQTPDRLFY